MKKLILMLLLCAPIAAMAQKFGHVNVQEIMQIMPEYTKAIEELKALQLQYETDLKSMHEEFTKKYQDYETNGKSLPENIRQRREQELADMQQKIQQSVQDNQQALAKAEQEKLSVAQTKLVEAIKTVGQEGGYVYIMNYPGSALYISTTLSTDVTAEVKAKLGLK